MRAGLFLASSSRYGDRRVHAVVHGASVFFHHLEAVRWEALGLAIAFHLLKVLVRTFAWRNILAAAYPQTRVPWPRVFGAYVAGVGVNAVAPARAGDAVKLVLVKRRLEGATYPTLAASLVVETLFDFVVAGVFFVWALTLGALPGIHAHIPGVDWNWAANHPKLAALFAGLATFLVGAVLILLQPKLRHFKARVRQGFAILDPFSRYVAEVVSWQALSWVFRLVSVYFFLRAFGLPGTVHNTLLSQVVQSLSTLLPFTPGGAGAEQGLLVYVFHGKLSASALLSFSVGQKIALTIVNVAAGALALIVMVRTLRWRRLAREREQPAGSG
jgi:uncharacterized membrane protein YbhN (UPF0104 family)